MKPKDLVDVLLKILGLSMCLNAIPSFLSQPLIFFLPFWSSGQSSSATNDLIFHETIANATSFAISEAARISIGIYVVVKSRKISEFLFKNEE
jgi:hypothetical protein